MGVCVMNPAYCHTCKLTGATKCPVSEAIRTDAAIPINDAARESRRRRGLPRHPSDTNAVRLATRWLDED